MRFGDLKIGMQVRITSGPLQGHYGRVRRLMKAGELLPWETSDNFTRERLKRTSKRCRAEIERGGGSCTTHPSHMEPMAEMAYVRAALWCPFCDHRCTINRPLGVDRHRCGGCGKHFLVPPHASRIGYQRLEAESRAIMDALEASP